MTAQLSLFISQHWWLCLAFVLILCSLFIYEWWDYQQKMKQLSPQDTVLLMNHEDAAVVDIRPAAAYHQGHILHAISVNKEESPDVLLKKFKNKPVIIVCQRGISAQEVGMKWKKAGIEGLHVLAGGMEAWQRDGLPIVTD